MHFLWHNARSLVIIALSLLLILLTAPLLMRAYASLYTYGDAQDVPPKEVAIVLGASVYLGEPSPVLAARAQAAVQLFIDGKVQKIIVSGDNSTSSHDEVTPVRKYLVDAGVPGKDIFLDHEGLDTYSSMYRARAIFGVQNAVVVTQSFHMPRSLFLARSLGIDAVGLVSDQNPGTLSDYLREIPASWKAILDVATSRALLQLGPAISLTTNGESTW